MGKTKQNQDHDAYRFLRLFREENETVTFGLLHESPVIANRSYKTMIHVDMNVKRLQESIGSWTAFRGELKYFIRNYNRSLGKGIFFVVNHGGKKDKDITSVRAWFTDVDFAKTEHTYTTKEEAEVQKQLLEATRQYERLEIQEHKEQYVIKAVYNLATVEQKKQEFMERHSAELKNAVIVETYSGYHIYWLAADGSLETFTSMQIALLNKFDGDTQCINLARVMRVPLFLHQKYETTFEVKVIQWSEKKWQQGELIQSLKLQVGVEQARGVLTKEEQEEVSHNSKLTRGVNVKVSKGRSDLVFRRPSGPGKKEMVFNECLDTILREPLTTFISSPSMEEGERVCCPFHNDKHPSGHVFRGTKGQLLYKCHACEIETKNIIGLYQSHTKSSFRNAVKSLGAILGIKIVKTEFEQKQHEKYFENRWYLDQNVQELFPYTAHYIDRYGRRGILRFLNDKAELTVTKEEFQYEGHNVFFISYRFIKRETNKTSLSAIRKTVFLMILLGFIQRVPEEDVPEDLKKRAEQEKRMLHDELLENAKELDEKEKAKAMKRASELRMINFYIVPNWNNCAFEIEAIAKEMFDKNFSFAKHITKIGLAMLLGDEVANRVYPDARKVPNRFQKIADKLKEEIEKDMETKGYSIVEDVLSRRIRINEKKETKTVTLEEKEDVFRRSMSYILKEDWKVTYVRSEKKKLELDYTDSKERKKLHKEGKLKSLTIRLISGK